MSNHVTKDGATKRASRKRRKKWLAGIAGVTGVVSLGLVAAPHAGAVISLDDQGGRQHHKDDDRGRDDGSHDRGDGRSGEDDRRVRSVPCDEAALFAAINQANQNRGGTLKLARDCRYELRTATATTTGSNALPPITTDITILGEHSIIERAFELPSAPPTLFRIFQVDPGGRLRLSDTTLRNGLVTAAPGGGALLVQPGGTAELAHVRLAQNNAAGAGVNGGAITNLGTTVLTDSFLTLNNAGASGGAIFNTGILRVEETTFENNRASTAAPAGGGAIASAGGAVTIRKSTFEGNQTAGNGGGLLLTGGSAEVSDTTFRLNVALGSGGGIANTGGALRLRDVKFLRNTALLAGGGLFTAAGTSTTILPGDDRWVAELAERHRNPGGTEQSRDEQDRKEKDGKEKDGGKKPDNDGGNDGNDVDRRNGTIFYGNAAGTVGGAIANAGTLTVRDAVILRNQAFDTGGGINNTGTLVVQRSVITENQAGDTGGGIFNAGAATIDEFTLVFRNNPNNCAGTPITNCQG